MRIRLGIDKARALRDAPTRSPSVSICWDHDGATYPDEHWTDFGLVLLGWWVLAAERLLAGASAETFFFMEGPHALECARAGPRTVEMRAAGRSFRWETPLPALASEIVRASRELCSTLQGWGVCSRELSLLGAACDRVDDLIKKAEREP